MLKKLAKCLREYKKAAAWTPILVAFEVVLECVIPFITANLVTEIEHGADVATVAKYGAVLILMAVLSLSFGSIAGKTCAVASCGFAKNLRKDMFYKIQDYSFENIDKFSTSSLVTRLTTDVGNIQMSFSMLIRIAVRAPFMMIFAFVMAFIMGGKLAWIFVLLVPLLGFGLIMVALKAMPIFRKVFKKYDNLNESVQENVKAIRVVKSFVREDYEKQKFHRAAEDVCRDFTKAEKILAFNNPMMQICLNLVMLFVMVFGSKMVITSRGLNLQVGQMSAMLTYSFMILSSLMMISMIFVMMTMSIESCQRVCEVLDETSTLMSPENGKKDVADGTIDFKNVSFKYYKQGRVKVLNDINLHIDSGMTVGIIGGTGSSKTSLIQLISRLYDTTSGTVKVGGTDVRDYDIEALRNQVAVVLQKNVLFSGTIKENLRWGNKEATDEEMREACRLACADEFIQSFPDKYDTFIEQGGANVSGGQKQRLCIARALLKRPKILILDDSTSAVDTKTDAIIRKSMREYIPETTKIIIAQRTASVEDADLIVVMDSGSIIAKGTHKELMKSCDVYREIYTSQNKAGDSDEE